MAGRNGTNAVPHGTLHPCRAGAGRFRSRCDGRMFVSIPVLMAVVSLGWGCADPPFQGAGFTGSGFDVIDVYRNLDLECVDRRQGIRS